MIKQNIYIGNLNNFIISKMPYYYAEYHPDGKKKPHCQKCDVKITEVQGFFECDKCKKQFHPRCLKIIGKNITELASKSTWNCLDCAKESGSGTAAARPK